MCTDDVDIVIWKKSKNSISRIKPINNICTHRAQIFRFFIQIAGCGCGGERGRLKKIQSEGITVQWDGFFLKKNRAGVFFSKTKQQKRVGWPLFCFFNPSPLGFSFPKKLPHSHPPVFLFLPHRYFVSKKRWVGGFFIWKQNGWVGGENVVGQGWVILEQKKGGSTPPPDLPHPSSIPPRFF